MHSETVHLNHSKSFVFRCSVMSDSLHPWTVARQAPRSMEFSSPESWSGEPFLLPGKLPNPGITPMCLCPLNWQEDSLPLAPLSSVQLSSVAQSCPNLCDPMNRSTPGLPVHHQLPEFTQIHIHQVRDAIQPSHPLSSPSPPAPNPSQYQDLFQ